MATNWKKEAARLGYWYRKMKTVIYFKTREIDLINRLHRNDKQLYFAMGKSQGLIEALSKKTETVHQVYVMKEFEEIKKENVVIKQEYNTLLRVNEAAKQENLAIKQVMEEIKQELNDVKQENELLKEEYIDTKKEYEDLEEMLDPMMDKIRFLVDENGKLWEKLGRTPEENYSFQEENTFTSFRSIREQLESHDSETKTQVSKNMTSENTSLTKKRKKRFKDAIETKKKKL